MINEFLTFCQNSYNREARCADCQNQCPETGNCEQCLENIHFRREDRTYNCSNISFYYSCKYSHKYSSEITHLFRFRNINTLTEFRVLSLGSGPCIDYLGIHDFLEMRNQATPISYLGIELNRDWEPHNNWIRERIETNFSVQYLDAYDFLENNIPILTEHNPNIVIISYLISDLIRNNCDLPQFINLFANNILLNLPINSFIIFNDYNRGVTNQDPRFHYSTIIQRFREISHVDIFCYHFAHNYDPYWRYGIQHASNHIFFPILTEIDRFNPWRFCTSAQLIIQKTA